MTTYELTKEDLLWCVKRLPNTVKKAMKDNPAKLSVAGGYIRSCITGDKLKDIDLFVTSTEIAGKVSKVIKCDNEKTFMSKNAYTLFRNGQANVQIIHKWTYERPELVITELDFSICCAVIWYESGKWQSARCATFYQDLAAKRLRYMSPKRIEELGGSAVRILKYYGKGYRITLDSYAKVIARVMSEYKWHKGCTEDQIAHVVRGLLIAVDPNSVREDQDVLGSDTLEDVSEEI